MSLNESIVEDAALEWFGDWAMRSGTGRVSRPVNRRRIGELNLAPLDSKPEAPR